MRDNAEPPVGGWLEVAVEVAGIDSDLVADLFRQACPGGVAVEPAFRPDPAGEGYLVDGDAPAIVKGYLPASPDAARLRRSLQMALRLAPLQRPPRWRRTRRLRGETWRDAWKRYFRPQRVGRSLVVSPSWARYRLRRDDTVVQIDPGMAFGTGQHPTTAMCLAAIEELLAPGMRVLDLGTGSGILAIAAAKLGAARVLALDTDPLAVQAARQNAAANGVAGLIEVREGSLDEAARPSRASGRAANPVPPGTFGLIAANISGLAIERLVPALARALAPGGALVVSGFLADSVEGTAAALRAAGLTIERVPEDGVWRAIIARAADRTSDP